MVPGDQGITWIGAGEVGQEELSRRGGVLAPELKEPMGSGELFRRGAPTGMLSHGDRARTKDRASLELRRAPGACPSSPEGRCARVFAPRRPGQSRQSGWEGCTPVPVGAHVRCARVRMPRAGSLARVLRAGLANIATRTFGIDGSAHVTL